MTSPKHLWSGDWERESAALSEELAGRRPAARDESPTRVAQAPAGRNETPVRPPPAPRAVRTPRSRGTGRRLHLALIIGLVTVLVLAAAGYGLSRLIGAESPVGTGAESANQIGGPIDWLGMQIEGVPPGTVVIATVASGSPAEQAGLEPGDQLLSVNGRPVNSTSDIGTAISGLHPGDGVLLQVSRGTTQLTTRATLGAPPANHP